MGVARASLYGRRPHGVRATAKMMILVVLRSVADATHNQRCVVLCNDVVAAAAAANGSRVGRKEVGENGR